MKNYSKTCGVLVAVFAVAAFLASGVEVPLAQAYSPPGTPARTAEGEAFTKMGQDYRGYRVQDCNLRSNGLSVAIDAVNPAGRRVGFRCLTRKVTRRDGTFYYEVGRPEIVQ